MPNAFQTILTSLGLTDEQVDIYTSLIQHGPQTATQLANTTQVKRTYVYRIIEQLMAQGLTRSEIKGKTTRFVAESPDKLLEIAEALKIKASQATQSLENILPSLKSMFSATDSKPVVTYYEGTEGVKKVYLDTLSTNQEILALVETSTVEPEIYTWVTQNYVTKRIAQNIHVKAIVSSGPNTPVYTSLDEQELRQSKIISNQEYPLQHEINIYGSKVAIINHHQGEKLMGIIIDHPLVAATFKAWFELTWNKL